MPQTWAYFGNGIAESKLETAAMPTRESDMRWRILLSDSKEMLNVAPMVVGISLATGNDINVAVSR